MKITALVLAATVGLVAAQDSPSADAIKCVKDTSYDSGNAEKSDACIKSAYPDVTVYVPINNCKRQQCGSYKQQDFLDCVQACIDDPVARDFKAGEATTATSATASTAENTSSASSTAPDTSASTTDASSTAEESASSTDASATDASASATDDATASSTGGAVGNQAALLAAAVPLLLAGVL